MKSTPQRFVLAGLLLLLGLLVSHSSTLAAEDEAKGVGEPLKLETSEHFKQGGLIKAFQGLQVINGLQFHVTGRFPLYGKSEDGLGRIHPEAAKGIVVGRSFEELHLIHFTYMPDVEGDVVANICINYADGSTYSYPIRYGVHIRDWYNLPAYEKETVTDQDTNICWRHKPYQFKAPVRLFKTKIANPLPTKVVKSIDLVSAKNLASYVLLAATVVDSQDIPQPEIIGDRKFDNSLVVEIVDDETGKPIEGAIVTPGMYVIDVGVYGSPFRTTAKGTGSIPYPTKDTSSIWITVKKPGYEDASEGLSDNIPKSYKIRLKPVKNNAIENK